MRIARFSVGAGPARPDFVTGDEVIELTPLGRHSDDDLVLTLLGRAAGGDDFSLDGLALSGVVHQLDEVQLLAPVRRPGTTRTPVRWTARGQEGTVPNVRTIRTWRVLRAQGRGLSLWAVARSWS